MHGVVATPFDAKQVPASLIPETTTSEDDLVLRSAKPLGIVPLRGHEGIRVFLSWEGILRPQKAGRTKTKS